MSQRGILLLGVITLVMMLVALLFTGARQSEPPEPTQALVPGLRSQVNELSAFNAVGPDGELIVALRRSRERWHVENRDDFEADFRRIHELLRQLTAARRAEPRTALPEWYPRLGLADIGSSDASGILIEFPGTELPAIILGERDPSTGGRYARLVGEAQSWLTDQPLETPDEALGWLERSVMDIPASELAAVTIVHADGDRVRLRPADEDGDQWVLLDVPDGREAAPRWEIRPVANGLASIELEEVRRHDGSVPEDAVRALYVTRDGLNFVVSLFADEDGRWAHFTVSAEIEAGTEADDGSASEQLLADAAAVDARLSPWQFALSSRKFETMSRRQAELLAPLSD